MPRFPAANRPSAQILDSSPCGAWSRGPRVRVDLGRREEPLPTGFFGLGTHSRRGGFRSPFNKPPGGIGLHQQRARVEDETPGRA